MFDLLGDQDICVPFVDGYHHPLAAVYRISIIDEVNRLLAENRLRPIFLFETVSTQMVEAHELVDVDPTKQSLRNLNTLQDYEKALHEMDSV
jgi:molybdopterin-guanine dinucleotide biosynthesis protein A